MSPLGVLGQKETSDQTIPPNLLGPYARHTRATATFHTLMPCMPPAMHWPALPAVYARRPHGRGGMGEALCIRCGHASLGV